MILLLLAILVSGAAVCGVDALARRHAVRRPGAWYSSIWCALGVMLFAGSQQLLTAAGFHWQPLLTCMIGANVGGMVGYFVWLIYKRPRESHR